MRRQPTYRYPHFVSAVNIEETDGKRYLLSLDLDLPGKEELLVILKNPSRANTEVSDKTVFNVCHYVYKNAQRYAVLQNTGRLLIANLIPHYLTDSHMLQRKKGELIDPRNLETIDTLCAQPNHVIVAWGNAPKGLHDTYEILKTRVMALLRQHQKKVFYVKQLSKAGNPRHGQVWGYKDPLLVWDDW